MKINVGPYCFDIESQLSDTEEKLTQIYGDQGDSQHDALIDFPIRIAFDSLVRRFIKPQVTFYCDQLSPFKPLPASQAYAVLEWGMNWCIAAHEYTKLVVHAAVLVKDGQAIVLPAAPGSGKSTLTTAFALRGWRCYSDEMAIIDVKTRQVTPLYRPVCIKNDAIALVSQWFPEAIKTAPCYDTQKGTVSHVKVTEYKDFKDYLPVDIAAFVFPKYTPGDHLKLYQLNQLQTFQKVSENGFNYNVLGETGFNVIAELTKHAPGYEMEYSDLVELQSIVEESVL